jgi:hypothetical protein
MDKLIYLKLLGDPWIISIVDYQKPGYSLKRSVSTVCLNNDTLFHAGAVAFQTTNYRDLF